jgi:hypothetical protein
VVPGHVPAGPDGDPEVARQLLEPLRATLRRVEGIPISSYEEVDGDTLVPLLDDTRAALDDAIDRVGALLNHYDGVAEQRASVRKLRIAPLSGGELCGELERVLEQENVGVLRVQNLAFVARLGLRGRVVALEGMTLANGKWEIIDAASSSLREVLKALGAIDVAVCELEGLPCPTTFYVTELERSLAIRRAYRILHADVAPGVDPRGPEVGLRLRRAANSIAKLAGRPIYASMRVHDRFMLRGVQRRLQAWLVPSSEDPKAREAAGVRLYQDVAHLAELMLGVNERAELRKHDAEIASETVRGLEGGQLDVPRAAERLRAIQGRDLELDTLLAEPSPPPAGALLTRLRALSDRLTPRAPSTPAPRPLSGELFEDDFL